MRTHSERRAREVGAIFVGPATDCGGCSQRGWIHSLDSCVSVWPGVCALSFFARSYGVLLSGPVPRSHCVFCFPSLARLTAGNCHPTHSQGGRCGCTRQQWMVLPVIVILLPVFFFFFFSIYRKLTSHLLPQPPPPLFLWVASLLCCLILRVLAALPSLCVPSWGGVIWRLCWYVALEEWIRGTSSLWRPLQQMT